MGLIERAEAIERERRSLSLSRFGHPDAYVIGYDFDWRAEALALETQLAGAVEALDAAIGEGSCAEGHAWADGFVTHCESCAKVARLANRVGGQ
jgi:hypothetical protein